MQTKSIIHLAPIQGFTDFVFRKCHHQVFGGIEEFYIPYIAFGPGNKIRNSQRREIKPENNLGLNVVPQVLCSNTDQLNRLALEIKDAGYEKLNLNLGCPYPMATKRGRGTALLENEEMLKQVLDALFNNFDFEVSVKFRSGLIDDQIIFERIELLNAYPFEKLIYHPRTAKQLYKGIANRNLFVELANRTSKPLVYNGDIHSQDDLNEIQEFIPDQNEWMIGRGILMNSFLPLELKGEVFNDADRQKMLKEFHQLVLESYKLTYQDGGHVLNKLKEFWTYFSYNFPEQRKIFKAIKKTNQLSKYQMTFSNLPLFV